ncbi:N-acetyl-D-Glu racemase DgcA [Psychromonas sp. Urea-02u-13]|uniref:N-acetyl-D-Glu racemase DgcA n=1 Tax=Psychromonas sp. Urea-02u-13 TaxID=2058326 RepID=UPI000C328683|nr:N-acetyl-D-Glu racemase DgcA [Psychromonas sp. Urea-02u-13]PKG37998.1 dipeptide epimerase [Psychromonas sp. Urea-02u-13]
MSQLNCTVTHQQWQLAKEFRISRGVKTQADVVVVTLSDGQHTGWAEAVPYARYGETVESVMRQITNLVPQLTNTTTGQHLLSLLPAGAARNALDCALWDLTAKQRQLPVTQLVGITTSMPQLTAQLMPQITAQTLSLDTVDKMASEAASLSKQPLIKIKLDRELVLERMTAIALAAPNSRFIIDANEAWDFDLLKQLLPQLKPLNVALIEQPLPSADDHQLAGFEPEIPLCADESCHTSDDLPRLLGLYQAINIKLDKTGGLTEALQLLSAAQQHDFIIMTGCMVGTSLAMAPAFLIAQSAAFVDLDGPLLLATDRQHAFDFEQGEMQLLPSELWGGVSNSHNQELLQLGMMTDEG